MHDECAAVEPEDQVFRAPLDAQDPLPADRRFEIRSDGPAQAPVANDQRGDVAPDESGRDAASGGFYFRELGQRLARSI
jgi:hypothetical protein